MTRPNLTPHRCKAALHLRRKTMPLVARQAGVSVRHLVYVIAGQRPGSQRVYQALRDAIGPDGWLFATGQTHLLADEQPHAAPRA